MQVVSLALHILRRRLRGSDLAYGTLSRFGASQGAFLPQSDSKLCLEGYPSSGNTFAMRLGQKLVEVRKIASHTHAYGSIARAKRMNVPTVLVLRRPQDAISSYCVRFDKEVPWAIREYIDFHERVVNDPSGLTRLEFEVLIKEPQRAVVGLAKFLGIEINEERAAELAAEARAELEATRKKQVDTVGVLAIGWPTEEKEKKKARVCEALRAHNKWSRCEALHRGVQTVVADLLEI